MLEELVELFLLVHQAEHVVGALGDEVGSGGEPAAVDDDVGAGDVGGLVAGQEQGGVADILGLAGAAERDRPSNAHLEEE